VTRLSSAARFAAAVAHEVVTEYRKLDTPPRAAEPAPPPAPGRDPESLPGCDSQLAYQDDPHAVRAFGFGPGQRVT
jgi:hypothetical protein